MPVAKLYNLARMSTATTGTGTITLGSAVSGYLSFAGAGATDGDTLTYAIKDGTNSEIGRGVYTASGTTLTRGTVLKSTNSGSAINLSGTAEVFITASAEDFLQLDTGGFLTTLELGHATDTTLSRSSAGELAIEGTVVKKVGKETVWIPASAMIARTTNGAAAATTELATNDIMLATLDFDQTTEEGAGFWLAMPKSWNESTVTFKPFWTAASGSGGVVWGLAAYSFSNDDPMDTAVSGQQTSTDTLIAANDMHVGPESSAITIGGSPAEGDVVYFEITREVANGSDTLSADARLIGVHVYITTNSSTDA